MSEEDLSSAYGRRPRCGLIHNMSAPPRSTVSFRPYGLAESTPSAPPPAETTCGLKWVLRADPDALLRSALPDVTARMRDLRHEALALAQEQDKAAASRNIARLRGLRLAGLITIAASLASEASPWDGLAPDELPVEALQDRLADLASRLPPPPPWMPAMAIAESLAGGGARSDPGSTDALAVLWALTHINGRTFDLEGPPHLAADIAEGGAYDLYVPRSKEPT